MSKKTPKTEKSVTEKRVPRAAEAAKGERIRIAEDPDSFMTMTPAWAFSICDREHERWSISKCPDIYETIIKKLGAFEGMTWAEIMGQSGGRAHGTNHHFENVGELKKEAQKRLQELRQEDLDQVFSLRLSGKERLYGILNDRVLRIIWYDPNHEIYPMSK